ncbi:uncharacterized protein BX663DRAFT_424741, partial [Cokeromyces recurvatus]|uniref:uncharacterized protein n=1 Tax=Cokeromyces recurvatus TaxID=90255 RepID=UPI00221ED001
DRSWRLHWRFGWLPHDYLSYHPFHSNQLFCRTHSIQRLHMHHKLQMLQTIDNHFSFLLNKLSFKKPSNIISAFL